MKLKSKLVVKGTEGHIQLRVVFHSNHSNLGNETNSLQLHALTRTECRQSLLILAFSVGSGVVLACYLYNVNNHSLLYYSDSISHLVRARQLIDHSSPGLEQIGTVWLPLPHLMLLPFSLVDLLFKTGLAGAFVSLPSLAIAAAIIYKIIKVQTNISWIAILGSCLFFLNPNILYLGVTAMTEALFMLLFVVAVFFFQKSVLLGMYSTRQEHSIISSIDIKDRIVRFRGLGKILGPEHNSMISHNLLRCAFFIALATLCRYEAWPIPFLLTLFIVIRSMKANIIDRGFEARVLNRKRLMGGLVCIVLSFSGIILWISYNWIYFNSPLEFLFSPYYSAAAQALEGQNRDFLFLQPLNVASIYGVNALVFFGPVTIVGAIFGYIVHRMSHTLKIRRWELVFLFLAIPPLFSFMTLVFGIGEMNSWWFNSRFMILLSPLLILLLSILFKRINDKIQKNKRILVYASFIIFLIYPVVILPASGGIVTLVDAKNSMSYGTRPFAMDLANVLGRSYDGGKVFIITGSAQQNIIMQASGIPLTNFYAAIEHFRSDYHQLQQFESDSHYVVLSKNPDASSRGYANIWAERQGELGRYFDKAYENPFFVLFVRN
jgi:hypothetical protein